MGKKRNRKGGNRRGSAERTAEKSVSRENERTDSSQAPETGEQDDAIAPETASDPIRAWAVYLLMAVLLFGIGASLYMAWHHEAVIYSPEGTEIVGCEETAKVNCDLVNTSEWSELLGVPVALYGFPTYLVMGFLALSGLLKRKRRTLGYTFGIATLTVLHAIVLFYVSKTQLHFVCAWCMRMYAVNLAAFILSWLAAGGSPVSLWSGSLKDLLRWSTAMKAAAAIFVGVLGISIGVQRMYRASLTGEQGPAPSLEASENVVNVGGEEGSSDPEGTLPALNWTVKTEDKNERPLALRPDDIWKGNPDASVVLVEYADFECGFCKRFSAELKRVYEAYGDRVLFVFRFYAMDPGCNPGVTHRRHARACVAAHGGLCARDQNKFWAFHDITFKNQHKLDVEALTAYARKAGLDVPTFEACMRDRSQMARVYADGESGKTLDIHGTPRLYINGVRYRGPRTAESVAREIERLLGTDAVKANEAARALRNVAQPKGPIPDDVPPMQKIEYGDLKFEIDTFEASIQDGKAVSGKGNVPAIKTNWFQAKEACEAAGKRLCTEREWLAVCQGALPIDNDGDGSYADDMIEGTAYPYSDFHQIGACWDGHYRDDTKRPVFTGSFPNCVSKDGVYDMTGNMEEWVGETPEKAILMGGAYDTKEDKARCYRPNDTFGAGYSVIRTGFRCCRSLD